MSQVAGIVIGSLVGIGLLTAGVKYFSKSENVPSGSKYQYTNTGMPDEGLTEYNNGYEPKFGVGGKKNKTKRKKQGNQSRKNK